MCSKLWNQISGILSSSYPSVFWLVGSLPSGIIASHSFHCCMFHYGILYSRKMCDIKSASITLRNTKFKFVMAAPEKNSRIIASSTYAESNGSVIGSHRFVWRPNFFFFRTWFRAVYAFDTNVYTVEAHNDNFFKPDINVIVKIKWYPYRPCVAQRVGRGIALLFHDRGTRMGWVVSSTPRAHFTPGKEPVPILQEAWWDPGPVWTGGKSRAHRDSIPERPARSLSLYRLSYPAHDINVRNSI